VPEALNFFLDSNVIIGYIFYQADHWGVPAKNVIENEHNKHYGVFVHEECFGIQWGKCDTIAKRINSEFGRAITSLKRNQSVDILLFDSEKWKISGIIQQIVSSSNSDLNSLECRLRNVQRVFETECDDRREIIKKNVMRHTRRLPYRDMYQILQKIIPDPDDIEVVLDAHDVGHHFPDIFLITGDGRHIYRNKASILPHTKIKDVKLLSDYR
jgi:hypothetical protein